VRRKGTGGWREAWVPGWGRDESLITAPGGERAVPGPPVGFGWRWTVGGPGGVPVPESSSGILGAAVRPGRAAFGPLSSVITIVRDRG